MHLPPAEPRVTPSSVPVSVSRCACDQPYRSRLQVYQDGLPNLRHVCRFSERNAEYSLFCRKWCLLRESQPTLPAEQAHTFSPRKVWFTVNGLIPFIGGGERSGGPPASSPGEARRRRHGGGGLPHVMCGARVESGVRECASGPGAYGLGARRRPSASNSILEKGILWIPFEGNSRRVIWQVYTRQVRAMCRAHPATILGIVRNLYTLTRAPVT